MWSCSAIRVPCRVPCAAAQVRLNEHLNEEVEALTERYNAQGKTVEGLRTTVGGAEAGAGVGGRGGPQEDGGPAVPPRGLA